MLCRLLSCPVLCDAMVDVERLLGDLWPHRNAIAHTHYQPTDVRRHLQRIGRVSGTAVQQCLLSAKLRRQHMDYMEHVLGVMWRRHVDAHTHDSTRVVRRYVLDHASLGHRFVQPAVLPARLCDAKLVAMECMLFVVWRWHAFAYAFDCRAAVVRRYCVPVEQHGERAVWRHVLCSKLRVDAVVGMVSVLGHVR